MSEISIPKSSYPIFPEEPQQIIDTPGHLYRGNPHGDYFALRCRAPEPMVVHLSFRNVGNLGFAVGGTPEHPAPFRTLAISRSGWEHRGDGGLGHTTVAVYLARTDVDHLFLVTTTNPRLPLKELTLRRMTELDPIVSCSCRDEAEFFPILPAPMRVRYFVKNEVTKGGDVKALLYIEDGSKPYDEKLAKGINASLPSGRPGVDPFPTLKQQPAIRISSWNSGTTQRELSATITPHPYGD